MGLSWYFSNFLRFYVIWKKEREKLEMRERDIFEEIIDMGKRRGVLTYDEINDALPSEFFSPDEIEDLMDLLQDMGVKVVDYEEAIPPEEEIEEEELEEYEKTEDLVQAYFHSMGDISILTKDEETELAKRLEEGREIIKNIILGLPLYKRIEESLDGDNDKFIHEEERPDEALAETLFLLEALVMDLRAAEKKIEKYESLKEIRRVIAEKRKKGINPEKLEALARICSRNTGG